MIVRVKLYNEILGTIDWIDGRSVFQYSSDALNKGREPSPIVMPLEGRIYNTNRDHQNFHNLPYLISDSMPDDFGNIMMKEWLKRKELSIEDINPVDRLTYIGKRGMGAIEFEPIKHKEGNDYDINISDLLEITKRVLENKKDTSYDGINNESLTDILRIGTSVGGARAKALVAIKTDVDNNITEIKPGDIAQPGGFSYWLLKIDGANKKTLGEGEGEGKIEYAYYQMALKAGIEMSESRLIQESSRFHFLTKRFDRMDNGQKIHMQTLGAIAAIDYRIPKASSYENLFRVMKRLQLPYYQFEQQYRRALFNVVARNHDDHVKNFSFLMDENGKWGISPAYDITYGYSQGGTWTHDHQSSINDKFNDFTKEDLFSLADMFGIKKAKHILEEVIEAVSQWPKIANDLDIPIADIEKKNKNLRVSDF